MKYKYTLFFIIILYSTTLLLYRNIPSLDEYYIRADEGTYYKQANALKDGGFNTIINLTDDYISNTHDEQSFPHPLRIGHILLASIALNLNSSIQSLSALSIFFYILTCLISFIFIRKWFGEIAAFFTGAFICSSPLICGLSERALADIDYNFFQLLTIFLTIHFINTPKNRNAFFLMLSLTITLFFKEASFLFFPFIAFTFFIKKITDKTFSWNYIKLASILIIPGVIFSTLIFMLLGIDRSFSFVEHFINALKSTNSYLINFSSGPWYVYIIGLLILSPIITISSCLYMGYYIFSEKKSVALNILLGFFIYFIFIFILFPKDIRFGILLDIISRIFASMLFIHIISKINIKSILKTSLILSLVAIIISFELLNYQDLFLKNKIYDPASYNLLKAKKIIP